MIEYEDVAEPGETAEANALEYLDRLAEGQDRVTEGQDLLRQDFERLAAAVTPLLTKQYRDTEARMRVLETRLRNRQERPLIVRMASLLADVRRLDSADDVKAHAEEALVQALTGVGYQEMGSAGDQFDPQWHEPVSGSVGRAGVVTRVHRRGLACYGDVIIKAQVDVEPDPAAQNEQGEL
jgi:molecular chaperone GrpE (heat shock protein)